MRNGVLMPGSTLYVRAPLRDIPYVVTAIYRPDSHHSAGPCEVHTTSESGLRSTSLLSDIERAVTEGHVSIQSPRHVDLSAIVKLGINVEEVAGV